jgi:tetratricopeptide (TPR) repeat protein
VVAPLNLPGWIPKLIILIVVIGFPIAAVLSWIFDLTPEGIKKTEKDTPVSEEAQIQVKARRKLHASDVIIAILFICVCVLLYPRIFKTRTPDTFMDQDGRVSVAVLPFRNMTADSVYDIWEEGSQVNLITRLTDSDKLSVRQFETMHELYTSEGRNTFATISPAIAGDLSKKLKAKVFLIGSIFKSEHLLRLSLQVGKASNEEIIKSFEINLSDPREILHGIDSLANLLRDYLEIEALRSDDNDDRVVRHHITTAEAYQYYILGMKADRNADYDLAVEYYTKAIELDSSFQAAKIELALCYYGLRESELWQKWLKEAMYGDAQTSEAEKLRLEFYRALSEKDMPRCIEIIEERLRIDDHSRNAWLNLGWANMQMDRYEQAIHAFERALDIVNSWGVEMKEVLFYTLLMEAYHGTGQHRKEKKLARQGLKLFPDHQRIVQLQAVCALSRGDLSRGAGLVAKYREIRASEDISPARIEDQTAWIYKKAHMLTEAEQHYRSALELDPDNPTYMLILAEFLTEYEVNVTEGIKLAELAQLEHPDDYRFCYPEGVGHYYLGNYKEAIDLLKEYDEHTAYYDHELVKYIRWTEEALSHQNQN